MESNWKKALSTIIKIVMLIFFALCVVTLVFFFIVFINGNELIHISPKIEVMSINDNMQNHYVAFMDNAYYYYKSNPTAGIYRWSDDTDEEKLYEISDIISIASDESFIYCMTESEFLKINFNGDLIAKCEMRNAFNYKTYYIIVDDTKLFIFSEPNPYPKRVASVCFDKVTMSLLGEDIEYKFDWADIGYNFPNYNELGLDDYYVFRASMLVMSDNDIIVIGIKDSNYGNLEKPLKKHLGDIICKTSLAEGNTTLVYSSSDGERVVYADQEKFVVYSLDKKGFSFFNMDNGQEYKFLQNKKIRNFKNYSMQSVANRLFIYSGEKLVDIIYLS